MRTLPQENKRVVFASSIPGWGSFYQEHLESWKDYPVYHSDFWSPESLVHWIRCTGVWWKEQSYLNKTQWKLASYVFRRDRSLPMSRYHLTSSGKMKFPLGKFRLWESAHLLSFLASSIGVSLGHICTDVVRLDWRLSMGHFSYGAPGVENSYSHGILFLKSPDISFFLVWCCILWNISAMWFIHRHNPEITQVFAKWVAAVWKSQQSCPEVLEVSPTWFLEVMRGLARLAQALSGRSLETLLSGAHAEVKSLRG